MPHQILCIDELLRLIIDELVQTSKQTVPSLACTCRFLEEPALSSLWRRQERLTDLLKVLPNHTWAWVLHGQSIWSIVSGRSSLASSGLTSPRRSNMILHRRTGPGCDDTLLGCADYVSVPVEVLPVIHFPAFHAVLPVGHYSPGWNGCTCTSTKRTSPHPAFTFSFPPN